MAAKKGSKNNIANRGMRAKIKFYAGKPVKEVKLFDRRNCTNFMAAQFENGDLVTSADGSYVKYASIQEFEPETKA